MLRLKLNHVSKSGPWKLEQLECLSSEDTPATQWLPILLSSSYWIPSPNYLVVHIGSWAHTIEQFILDPKSKQDSQSYKSKEFAKTYIFLILKTTLHTTHLLKLLDKVCKYEMDLASIVEDTEQTWFCPQKDRWTDVRTDGHRDKVKPVYPPSTSLSRGIINRCVLSTVATDALVLLSISTLLAEYSL